MAIPENPDYLTDTQKQMLIDSIYAIQPIFETAKQFGFTTKGEFQKYLRKNPEFAEQIKQARIDACDFIEDELLNIPNNFDAKMAKTVVDIYTKVLSYRKPEKYSPRIDMTLNQTVSILHNIAAANDRIKQVYELAVPKVIRDKTQAKPESSLKAEEIEVTNSDESRD